MNPLSEELATGTIGELLVQCRLLQYDVQAVSPLKDTGNDLLAIRGDAFRAIQVKTYTGDRPFTFNRAGLMERQFHILALVRLSGEGNQVWLDESRVFLLTRNDIVKGSYLDEELEPWTLAADRIERLWSG